MTKGTLKKCNIRNRFTFYYLVHLLTFYVVFFSSWVYKTPNLFTLKAKLQDDYYQVIFAVGKNQHTIPGFQSKSERSSNDIYVTGNIKFVKYIKIKLAFNSKNRLRFTDVHYKNRSWKENKVHRFSFL